jgi:hypothetical protein
VKIEEVKIAVVTIAAKMFPELKADPNDRKGDFADLKRI